MPANSCDLFVDFTLLIERVVFWVNTNDKLFWQFKVLIFTLFYSLSFQSKYNLWDKLI